MGVSVSVAAGADPASGGQALFSHLHHSADTLEFSQVALPKNRFAAELLDAGFWQQAQEDIRSGAIRDFFLYPESLRFCNRYGGGCPK